MVLWIVLKVNDPSYQIMTYPIKFLLTIVGLSYTLSYLIRTRRQSSESIDTEAQMSHENGREAHPTAVPLTALVIDLTIPSDLTVRPVPVYGTSDPVTVQLNDSPPLYDDCPPPNYEDAIKGIK